MTATTLTAIKPLSRIYGFGSIYGKTIRDSRFSFLIAVGIFGGLALAMGSAIGTVFPTPADRVGVDKLVNTMPAAMINLFGNATLMGSKLGTLGGYMTWKYGAMFLLGTGMWSILALTGTLAGEAAKGSLDIVSTTPFGKRRIAIEKLAAHLTLLWLTMLILALAITTSSSTFGSAAMGDIVPLGDALAFAALVGSLAMCFGGLAFALGPVLGRGGAAGVASLAMMLLWAANGLDIGGPLVAISPFRWTTAHIPLVGLYSWPGVAAAAALGVAFLAAGVELFNRRDLGVTAGLGLPGLPQDVLGVRGPVSRAFGDQLPRALAWGIGLAFWGVIMASLVSSFATQVGGDAALSKLFANVFPGYDFTTAGGWLQLYAELFYIFTGLAAATFVSKWASDETDGRLEAVLTTPMARVRWVLAGGVAALLAVVVVTVLFALGIAVGAAAGGGTTGDALLGSASLGLFGAAMVGVGVAVGGLWRTSLAAEITAVVVIATYLVGLFGPALNWPDWISQLALTNHVGQPMIGRWDMTGVVACAVIAVGGIALGAWGASRRDIER
jgi:ABC-2 type transport system permease protein